MCLRAKTVRTTMERKNAERQRIETGRTLKIEKMKSRLSNDLKTMVLLVLNEMWKVKCRVEDGLKLKASNLISFKVLLIQFTIDVQLISIL